MNHTTDSRVVGQHFLSFTLSFLNRFKNQYQQQNCIRVNTLAFHTLVTLSPTDAPHPTMSQLASQLGITKQQLTKLVNDLEEKGLVLREHDSKNRRQVYLMLTPSGLTVLNQLKEEMLSCTISGFSSFTEEELAELDHCLLRLTALLERFHPDSFRDSFRSSMNESITEHL